MMLTTDATAHPGDTDSSGGHYDRTTGEYHYHHGYPAHDHYDMDGDGDIDCPYNFDNQTGRNSGSSSNEEGNPATKKVKKVPTWVYWIFGIEGFLILCLWVSNKSLSSKYNDLFSRYRADRAHDAQKMDQMRSLIKAEVLSRQEIQDSIEIEKRAAAIAHFPPGTKVNHRDPHPMCFFEDFDNSDNPFMLPPGVSIIPGGKIALGFVSGLSPYGKYTVYVSLNGKHFHSLPYCHGTSLKPENIFSVIETRKPCSHCCSGQRYPNRLPAWYLNYQRTTAQMEIEW